MNVDKIIVGDSVVYLSANNAKRVSISILLNDEESVIQNIQSDQCYVLIKEKDIENVNNIVLNVIQELQKRGIEVVDMKINLVATNADEVAKFKNIENTEQFEYNIVNSNSFNNRDDVSLSTEEKKEDVPFEKFWNSNIVKKEDNGVLKSFIHRKGDDNSKDYMLEDVLLLDLFNEFKRLSTDLQFRDKVSNMNEDQIGNLLLDSIAESRNLKKYYMDSANEIKDSDADLAKRTVVGVTADKDGVGNLEIGVVNSVDSSDSYKIVEEHGDQVNVGSPSVVSNSGGLSSGSTEAVDSDSYETENQDLDSDNLNSEEEKLQSRNMEHVNVRRRVLTRPDNHGFVSIMSYLILAVLAIFILAVIFFR